jgi:hypothetical protein
MRQVIITKHFRERLKERFGLSVSEVFNVNRSTTTIWNKKNLNQCPNMMIRKKLSIGTDSAFMVENRELGLVMWGNISKEYTFLNTVIGRTN